MDYYELQFKITPKQPGNEIVISKLAELGFESFMEEGDSLLAYACKDVYQKIKTEILELRFDNIEFTVIEKLIPSQNWNETWEKDFKPVYLENKLVIRAPFHNLEKPAEYEVIIQPQMSFGTGHHNTTSLLASEMLKKDLKNKYVLDVGTGTGVLAILAEKLGAHKVIGTEIDEGSYKNANENIERNNCKNILLHEKDIADVTEKDFDVIMANINKNVLLQHLSDYAKKSKSGADLWMSGFFDSDAEELIKAAKKFGFTHIESISKDIWAVIKLKKD